MFPALQDDAVIGGCCWCCSELRTRALIPESIEMRRGVVAPGTNAQEYMKDCVLEMPWTRCCESAADYWLDIFLLSNTALIKNCWSERRVCTRQNKRKRCVVDFLLTFSWTACYFCLVTLKWPWRHSHMVFYKEPRVCFHTGRRGTACGKAVVWRGNCLDPVSCWCACVMSSNRISVSVWIRKPVSTPGFIQTDNH